MTSPTSGSSKRPTPRRGWERARPAITQTGNDRNDYKPQALSPSKEILAKHDAELRAKDVDDDEAVFCF